MSGLELGFLLFKSFYLLSSQGALTDQHQDQLGALAKVTCIAGKKL
jgi:hypothetical protein